MRIRAQPSSAVIAVLWYLRMPGFAANVVSLLRKDVCKTIHKEGD